MLYRASWIDLKNILQWLRGQDESQWGEQAKALSDTIAVFKEFARPIPHLDRSPNPGLTYTRFRPYPQASTTPCPTCEECWKRCVCAIDRTQSIMEKQLWRYLPAE
jgi:hypothetical protein